MTDLCSSLECYIIFTIIFNSFKANNFFLNQHYFCNRVILGQSEFTYVVHSISFQTFFTGIWICRRLLKIQYVIAIHRMRWQTNFYDFRFQWTATAAIGIHPTKAWLSQLVNFQNAIWTWGHFRRTICNKIMFQTWKKPCHKNVWNASDCFSIILHESRISFWVA